MFNIYAHLDNNKIVYIGKGLNKRLDCANYINPTYSKTWLKYFKEKEPVIEVLLEELSYEEAELNEWLAIREFSPILNCKEGGSNGKYIKTFSKSEESKLKASESNKAFKNRKKGSEHSMFGKKQSFHSNAQNAFSNGVKPFIAINKITQEQHGPFYFRRQATDALNIPYSPNIGSCLSGKLKSYKGFIFRRVGA